MTIAPLPVCAESTRPAPVGPLGWLPRSITENAIARYHEAMALERAVYRQSNEMAKTLEYDAIFYQESWTDLIGSATTAAKHRLMDVIQNWRPDVPSSGVLASAFVERTFGVISDGRLYLVLAHDLESGEPDPAWCPELAIINMIDVVDLATIAPNVRPDPVTGD
jgi:hypothetical protein